MISGTWRRVLRDGTHGGRPPPPVLGLVSFMMCARARIRVLSVREATAGAAHLVACGIVCEQSVICATGGVVGCRFGMAFLA